MRKPLVRSRAHGVDASLSRVSAWPQGAAKISLSPEEEVKSCEPWKPLPTNLSKMMNASHKNFDEEQLKEEHARLKPVGDDQINGVAAKVYELSTDDGSSKVWIAADASRILKVERDYEGEVSTSRPKMSADLKTLQAQLKAATAQHHLHSVANFVYDPSIKITMPAP